MFRGGREGEGDESNAANTYTADDAADDAHEDNVINVFIPPLQDVL